MVVSADNAWPWTLLSNRFRTNFRFEFSHNSAIINFLIFSYRPPRSSQNVHDCSSSVDRGEEEATRKGRNVVRKQKQKNLHNIKQPLEEKARHVFFRDRELIRGELRAKEGSSVGIDLDDSWGFSGHHPRNIPTPMAYPPPPRRDTNGRKKTWHLGEVFFEIKKSIDRSRSKGIFEMKIFPPPPFFFSCTVLAPRQKSRLGIDRDFSGAGTTGFWDKSGEVHACSMHASSGS